MGWRIYPQDFDFAASDKKEGDWPVSIKERFTDIWVNIFGKILMENWEECTVWWQAFPHSLSPVPCHFGSLKQAKFIVVNGSTLKRSSRLFFVISRNALTKKWLLIIEFLCHCFNDRFKQCIIWIWHQVDKGHISTVKREWRSRVER